MTGVCPGWPTVRLALSLRSVSRQYNGGGLGGFLFLAPIGRLRLIDAASSSPPSSMRSCFPPGQRKGNTTPRTSPQTRGAQASRSHRFAGPSRPVRSDRKRRIILIRKRSQVRVLDRPPGKARSGGVFVRPGWRHRFPPAARGNAIWKRRSCPPPRPSRKLHHFAPVSARYRARQRAVCRPWKWPRVDAGERRWR